jgi:tRNA(adenine34) deaminase
MRSPDSTTIAAMGRALRLARSAAARGEIPVGAVVLRDGEILGAAGNRSIASHDPTGHAEIRAIRRAARRAGNYRLTGAILVVTLEPCLMCLGGMVHARIGGLVYGARDPKIGAVSSFAAPALAGLNHRFPVHGGLREEECAALLRGFFRTRRATGGRVLPLRIAGARQTARA